VLISTIIVSADTRSLLEACLRSVEEATAGVDAELIVVDNASTDGSVEMVRERFPDVQLITNERNLGFAAASNQGLRRCAGRLALLLNSDTVLDGSSLEAMIEFMAARPRAGMLGPRLVDADGATQASASDLPGLRMQIASFLGLRRLVPRSAALALARTPGVGRGFQALTSGYLTPELSAEPTRSLPKRVAFLSGACLLARRELWEQIGLLDERIFLFLEDADWCRRAAEAGWELWYLPGVEVVHFGGASFRARSGGHTHHVSRERAESLMYYFGKHEPHWKLAVLRLVIFSSLRARLLRLAIGRAAGRVDTETYTTDSRVLRDTLRSTRR
jgi:N-acetylglucosaminyl-diphospho-decaprenol L-rhamnosyltransferase